MTALSNIFYLQSSPVEVPARLEHFAAQARLVRQTSPLTERAACALLELEHQLETEAARLEEAATLAAHATEIA